MIFSAQPSYRVIAYSLGEDGTDSPPAMLNFGEYDILAWRTSGGGLVPRRRASFAAIWPSKPNQAADGRQI
jgi:hypothetical protein